MAYANVPDCESEVNSAVEKLTIDDKDDVFTFDWSSMTNPLLTSREAMVMEEYAIACFRKEMGVLALVIDDHKLGKAMAEIIYNMCTLIRSYTRRHPKTPPRSFAEPKFGAALIYVADKQLEPGWLKVLERNEKEVLDIHNKNNEVFKTRRENGGPSQEEELEMKYDEALKREDAIKTLIGEWNKVKHPDVDIGKPWTPPTPFLTSEVAALAGQSYLQAIEKHSWEFVPTIMSKQEADKVSGDLCHLVKVNFLGYAIHPNPPVRHDYIFWPNACRYYRANKINCNIEQQRWMATIMCRNNDMRRQRFLYQFARPDREAPDTSTMPTHTAWDDIDAVRHQEKKLNSRMVRHLWMHLTTNRKQLNLRRLKKFSWAMSQLLK